MHSLSPVKITAAAAVVALLLAGCGSSGSAATSRGPAVDPVSVLRKIDDCALPSGTSVGDRVGSVRFASCMIPDPDAALADGDQITVYASPVASDLADELQTQGGTSTDGSKIIAGAGWFLTDTGSADFSGGTRWFVNPHQVALETGGTVR